MSAGFKTIFLGTLISIAFITSVNARDDIPIEGKIRVSDNDDWVNVSIQHEAAEAIIKVLAKKIKPVVSITDGLKNESYVGKNIICKSQQMDADGDTAYICRYSLDSSGKINAKTRIEPK